MSDEQDVFIMLSGDDKEDAQRKKLILVIERKGAHAQEAVRLVLLHLWHGKHYGGSSDYRYEIRELLEATGGVPERNNNRVDRDGQRIFGERRLFPKGFTRAGGDCICHQCGQTYLEHPLADEYRSWEDEPYLNRLCDGRLVKL